MIDKLMRKSVMSVTALWAVAALALATVAVPDAARAQTAAQTEWNKTLEAARKEGGVVVGGAPTPRLRNLIHKLWTKDFPDIPMNMSVAHPRGFAGRVTQERKAGKYLWDAYCSVSNAAMFRAAEKFFDPLRPALILDEVTDPKVWHEDFSDGFTDKKEQRIFAFLRFLSAPWYNAKVISPERVKKEGFKVMLDPAYKGKIAMDDPRRRGNGARNATLVRLVLGDADYKKVLVDQEPVFYRSLNDVAEAMARGKAVISVGANLDFRMDRYKKAGLDVDMRPFGNTAKTAAISSGAATLAIFNRPPHPNAAKVFVNWILTKKVQIAITKTFRYDSRRKDIPSVTGPDRSTIPGVKYLYLQKEKAEPLTEATIRLSKKLRPPN